MSSTTNLWGALRSLACHAMMLFVCLSRATAAASCSAVAFQTGINRHAARSNYLLSHAPKHDDTENRLQAGLLRQVSCCQLLVGLGHVFFLRQRRDKSVERATKRMQLACVLVPSHVSARRAACDLSKDLMHRQYGPLSDGSTLFDISESNIPVKKSLIKDSYLSATIRKLASRK